ncbi:MAG TPA: glycosyltransferase family 4 protein [Thermoanaerobaculia bacterium]|jgi:glycosyltransferase involved in cell wall biosynthesis|nr:glycosyltransferase family 4 protein [Thermoanaerobaculia bacterium]
MAAGKRVAMFSPLPPLSSGIADYCVELLPHLSARFDLELFAEEGSRLDAPAGADGVLIHPWRAFASRHAERPFDAVIYQLGNNGDFHAGAYRTLFETPGIVVLHEIVLHHMLREMTLAKGDAEAYLEEIRYAAGKSGMLLARGSLETGTPLDAWRYPLFEKTVDASLGVLVHSEGARKRVLASRLEAAVFRIPFPWTPAPPLPARSEVLARLGLPADAFVIASFGFLTRSKRLDVALRAFATLARETPNAVFLAVGEISKDYDLAALVPADLATRVRPLGRVDLDTFHSAMAVTDVAINLRYPSGGETSATLMRLLGLARAVIVTDGGSFTEIPDDACARVPPDESEGELLLEILRRLAKDEPLRRAMGENARRFVSTEHRIEQTADAYLQAVEGLHSAPRPARAVPPLAPYPAEEIGNDLIAAVAADLVDLGGGERDAEILAELALELADLGWVERGR